MVDKDPLVVRDPLVHKRVLACVAAALETKGVFAAPTGTRPDFIVEVDYGSSRGVGVPGMRGTGTPTEHFLQLSGRKPRADGAKGRGEELWNVRTAVYEAQVTFATLAPVLAAVAADYAGLDTLTEKTLTVAESAPTVVHVKAVAEAN